MSTHVQVWLVEELNIRNCLILMSCNVNQLALCDKATSTALPLTKDATAEPSLCVFMLMLVVLV